MNKIKTFQDFLNEKWDPSMSMDSSAPFNQPDPFTEINEPAITELEQLLKKTHDIPEDFWDELNSNNKVWDIFDNEMEELTSKLYDELYTDSWDNENDAPNTTAEYKKVISELEKTTEWKKAEYYQKNKISSIALSKNIFNKNAEKFWPIYNKAIKAIKAINKK